jgi:hypothetical protein
MTSQARRSLRKWFFAEKDVLVPPGLDRMVVNSDLL